MKYNNLNNRLQAMDSLSAGTREFTSSLQFDINNDLPTNYIGSASIRNFNFSQGEGGTLTLGGTSNGNGVLSIKNSGGTEIVKADNTGITVTGGNISVKDTAGSTVFDSAGVVSLTNFSFQGTSATSIGTISGSTPTDLIDTSFNLVLTRAANVMFLLNVQVSAGAGTYDTASARVFYSINVGGTSLLPEILLDAAIGPSDIYKLENVNRKSYTTVCTKQVGAGTTVVKATGYMNSIVNMESSYYNRSLYAVVLGK